MRIAMISSEVAPWSMTGGLAEVSGALPAALHELRAELGIERVSVFTPLYRQAAANAARLGHQLEDTGVRVSLMMGDRPLNGRFVRHHEEGGGDVFFLECAELYERDGLYVSSNFEDYGDNADRFGFLCLAVLEAATELLGGPPDILHAHDWQAALVPTYLSERYRERLPATRTVFTIHNLGYQGVFPKETMERLGLPWSLFTLDGLEFWDRVNLLKGGLHAADAVTTVSPTYAGEIQTAEFGWGLDGFLRLHSAKLHGILNGIDTHAWDPRTDRWLAANYDADSLDGKLACREALASELGLQPATNEPILAVIARFAGQKGLDLVADLVPQLHSLGAHLVVLGAGDPSLERRFTELARHYGDRLVVRIGFDDGLAHRIEAGSDIFLMPSRYEPCGLNQMYSMAYGTVPVAHAVGGLRDTVIDADATSIERGEATGYRFEGASFETFRSTVERAIRQYRYQPDIWFRIMQTGMATDFSWNRPARAFGALYASLLADRDGSIA